MQASTIPCLLLALHSPALVGESSAHMPHKHYSMLAAPCSLAVESPSLCAS